ncbi:hypothetical protein [Legionella fairfieldensis]|uniref:hypothetical protein n=1 Tax=Legionella fairfieldensis TaxID=45064 RepID=UPI00048B0959|nr:hypothetical protein [Legionella fairfieldensis]
MYNFFSSAPINNENLTHDELIEKIALLREKTDNYSALARKFIVIPSVPVGITMAFECYASLDSKIFDEICRQNVFMPLALLASAGIFLLTQFVSQGIRRKFTDEIQVIEEILEEREAFFMLRRSE